MASEEKNLIHKQSSQDLQIQRDSSAGSDRRPELSLSPKRTAWLPGNRPIADNTTDDIDELMGYLD